MAEEGAVEVSPPAPLDHHKRKLEDLEPEKTAPPSQETAAAAADGEPDGAVDDDDNHDDNVAVEEASDGSEAKRPRLDGEPDSEAGQNGHQFEKEQMVAEDNPEGDTNALEDEQNLSPEVGNEEHPVHEDLLQTENQPASSLLPSSEEAAAENVEKLPEENHSQPADEASEQPVSTSELDISVASDETTSQKIEVPNNKVGVLIGKAGDTIRYLQYNSGAKIQITRDAEADPHAATRPVELIGTLESIIKAKKLIKDVIAEADAGGSPALVARGFTTTLAAGAMEQVQIQVPNERVGLIIGKGGDTIKSLQTRSGARIQLIPQHLPEGDQSKERTVRICGDKKQIEMARELINEVMNQTVRPSTQSSNYNQQQFHHARGPVGGPPQWRSRGGPQIPQPYDYHQPRGGPYPSQGQQYPPYGSYPSQGPPKGNFSSGWEHRPPVQGPHSHSGGYGSYYGGQGGGHSAGVPPSAAHHPPMGQNMAAPHSQSYNYAQQPPSSYPQQTLPPNHQPYGQGGYTEPKYENQAPAQQPYSGGVAQPGSYPDAQGQYPPQQQYRAATPYGATPQVGPTPSQTYPASQVGDNAPYQAPVSVAPQQSYGQSIPPQQSYPYSSATGDPYAQPPPQAAGPVAGYSHPGGALPVAGYGQPHQAAGAYTQGYGQYPQTQQPNYGDQTGSAVAGYGYQNQPDPSGYSAGQAYNSGQAGYAQPVAAQAGYDQSAAQPAPYQAPVQGSTPAAYGKTVSPQPGGGGGYTQQQQYDATQMYGAAQ